LLYTARKYAALHADDRACNAPPPSTSAPRVCSLSAAQVEEIWQLLTLTKRCICQSTRRPFSSLVTKAPLTFAHATPRMHTPKCMHAPNHNRRQLNTAIAQESFSQAAQLRDKVRALTESLPPVQQFLYTQLERLRSGSLQERREAISALGEGLLLT
jgi:hypothetical protein